MNLIKYFVAFVMLTILSACGGGGGNPGTSSAGTSSGGTSVVALFTSAPASLTLSSGTASTSYDIGGGVSPYAVSADTPSLISVSLSGTAFTIAAAAGTSGSGLVVVTDSKGAKVSISVAVPSPTALFSTAPTNLTLAIGASSSAYTVSGGTTPYTASSSNPGLVSASIPAGTNLLTIVALPGTTGGPANVIISDAKGAQLTISVTVLSPATLFSTSPTNLTLAIGASSSAYTVSGGTAPYTASTTNAGLVSASIPAGTNLLTISALSGTTGGAATVTVSDAKGAQLTISVTVSPPTTLISTAPTTLTLAIGATSSAYTVSGGTTPYTASSSNPGLVSASIPAGTNLLTIVALPGTTGGPANVIVSDAKGNQFTIPVTVSAPVVATLFVDAPANLTIASASPDNIQTYTISGGIKPYTAVSSNPAVATATKPAADGSFEIRGIGAGNATVTIKDAVGTTLTPVSVTVPSSTALFSTAPSALQILNGTSNFYTVYGGAGGYVVNTNGVIANAVITGSSLVISGRVPGNQTVAISDAKGAVLLIDVTVKDGLYTDAPTKLSVPVGTGAKYTIYGGIPFSAAPLALYKVNSSNPAVVTATVNVTTLEISGLSSGSTSLVITDSVGASTVITVTVPVAGAIMSTAPSSLSLPIGGGPLQYAISGGNGIYTAKSSNSVFVNASVTGSVLTLEALPNTVGGIANVVVTDTAGTAALTIVVTAAPVTFFTTAPSQLAIAAGAAKTFAVYGGTLPYTVVNTHPNVATGSITGSVLTITGTVSGSGTVIVNDAKGVSVSIAVAVNTPGPLYLSAPSAGVTIASPNSVTYDIIGGVPPYLAPTSTDLTIARATIVNANQLKVEALGSGTATIAVTDLAGTQVTVQVTVPSASTSVMFTSAPAAGVFLASTDVNSYVIFGGVPAYTVLSSNENVVHAVISSGGFQLQATGGGTAQVLVRDTSGLSVTVAVTVASSNTLFVTAPNTLHMGVMTVSPAYQVSGGAKPYTATSSDTRVAAAVLNPLTSQLTINALAVGSADLKIADALGAVYPITVVVDNPAGTGTSSAATLDILASSNTLNSTPGSTVSFIVTVKDGANTALPNQTVVFTASSGTLTGANPAPVTNAAGTISTVSLSPGADASNRSITVTATTGGISKNIVIPVVGTAVSVSGPGAALVGSAAQNFTLKAVDSSGKPVVGAVLSIASSLGNGLSSQTVTTDISGAATVLFTATNAGIGADTLTVSGQGTSSTASVVVSNVDFAFTGPAPAALLPVTTANTVTVRYAVGGVGQNGLTVNFATTRGTLYSDALLTLPATTAVTAGVGAAAGVATIYVKSDTAGPVTVSAQLGAARSSLTAAFVATVPATLVLQANPAALLPNTAGSTTNQSTLTAVVRDAIGNPLQGKVVNFNAIADASGGSISPGSVTTDAGGVATAQFISGPSSTADNGVVIQAVVQSSPAILGNAALTVSGSALFISIARSNTLGSPDATTYQKDFSVYVTDATGAPTGNRAVTLLVRPTNYGKGVLTFPGTTGPWTYASNAIRAGSSQACLNEDANKNGILDAGEDRNGNGKLDPGNPVVITASVTTDASGFGTFTLRYGKNYALWVSAQITAKSLVSGTESSQVQDYVLEMSAEDAAQTASPANVTSPFGYGAVLLPAAISCTDPS